MLYEIIVSGIILLVLDSIYFYVNQKLIMNQLKHTPFRVKINQLGAFFSYIFLISGLYFFIIRKKRPIYEAFLLGIIIYGVYDATSYALLLDYSPDLAVIDTIWGGILLGITTKIVYTII